MSANKDAEVTRQIAELGGMPIRELQARFLEVWGEPTTNRNLTAVAKAATGSHWNGRHFFGLGPAKQKRS